ncbi:unnamed protein product [Ectocarpus sp. 12 AP-2014]
MSLRKNCDYCVSKKVTCDGNAFEKSCSRCVKRNRLCTFSPKQKSGPKPTTGVGARPANTQAQQSRVLAPTSPPTLSLCYNTPKSVHPRAAGDRNGNGLGGGVVVAPVRKGSGCGGGRVAGGSDGGGTSSTNGNGWGDCGGGGFAGAGRTSTASEHVPQTTLLEGRRKATRRDGRENRYGGGSADFASHSFNTSLGSISTSRPISFYSGSSPGWGGDTGGNQGGDAGGNQGKGRRHHPFRWLEGDFDEADSGSDTNDGPGAGGGSKPDDNGIRSGSGDGRSVMGRGKGVGNGNADIRVGDDENSWGGLGTLGYGSLGPDWLFQGLPEADDDHEDSGHGDKLEVQNQGQQQVQQQQLQDQVMSSKKRKEVPAGAAKRDEKGHPRKRHQILEPGSRSVAGSFDTPPATAVVAAETAANTPFLERWQERESRWQRKRSCLPSRCESSGGLASSLKLPGPSVPASSPAPITASPQQQQHQPPLLPLSDPNNSSSGSSCYKPLFLTTSSFTAGNGRGVASTASGGPGVGAGSFGGFPESGGGDGGGGLATDSFLVPSASPSAASAPRPDPALFLGGAGFRSHDENLVGPAAAGTYCCDDFGIVEPCPVSWYGPGERIKTSELGLELDRELSLCEGTVELPGSGGVGGTIFGASLGDGAGC